MPGIKVRYAIAPAMVSGNPARDHREWMKAEVMVRKLPKVIARVDALERELHRDE